MSYIPKQGDIVFMRFGSLEKDAKPVGHEEFGSRPAIVLSDESYNRKTGLFRACPITKVEKGYPFELRLKDYPTQTYGVVLCDHHGNFSVIRIESFLEVAPEELLEAVKKRVVGMFL